MTGNIQFRFLKNSCKYFNFVGRQDSQIVYTGSAAKAQLHLALQTGNEWVNGLIVCPCSIYIAPLTDTLQWSTVAMRALTWVVFVPRVSHQCCALQKPFTDATAGWAYRMHKTTRGSRSFGLHEIFKCGHLKFTVYGHKQASKQTYTQLPQMQLCTLVWGSLRLAAINKHCNATSNTCYLTCFLK